MSAWDNFFVAQVGASAALAGLLFVGLSINMTRILQFPVLPDRAMQALILLVTVLIVASLTLVPGANPGYLGLAILGIGAAVLGVLVALVHRVLRRTTPQYRHWFRHIEMGMTLLAGSLYVVAGAGLVAFGGVGLTALVPAMLLSYVITGLSSWVLLVEINR